MSQAQKYLDNQLESLGYKCDGVMGDCHLSFSYRENSVRYMVIILARVPNDPLTVYIYDRDKSEILEKRLVNDIDAVIDILNSKGIFSNEMPTKGVYDSTDMV